MTTTTAGAARVHEAARTTSDERLPKGLVLFFGLMVSFVVVVGVTFGLASSIHAPATPRTGTEAPAATTE